MRGFVFKIMKNNFLQLATVSDLCEVLITPANTQREFISALTPQFDKYHVPITACTGEGGGCITKQ